MLDESIPMLRLLHDERARSDEDACAKGQAGKYRVGWTCAPWTDAIPA